MRSYFDAYMDEPDNLPALLESMQQAPLISFKTLAEAWPHEYKRYHERRRGSDPVGVSRDDSLTDLNGGVPRLTDLIIHPALLRCIADGDLSAIEPFLWMPDKKPAVTRVLQELNPFPNLALPLLDGILEFAPNDIIDLSRFSLTSSQVVQFVSQHHSITKLSLAGMELVTIDSVKQLLKILPRTSYLNILDTPVLPSEIAQLLATEPRLFYHVETLLHPVFLTSKWSEPANDLFFTIPHTDKYSVGCPALPYTTPAKIVQAVIDFLEFNGTDGAKYDYGSMATVCLSSELRTPGQGWGARAVPIFPIVNNPTRLKGPGWFFVSTRDYYAFCRRPGGIEASLHVTDVRGCMESMTAEGRPPPREEDIKKLEELLAMMKYKTGGIEDITEFEAKLEKIYFKCNPSDELEYIW